MRLEYRILWVDDQIEDFIEMGIKDELNTFLENLSFRPEIDCYETAEIAEHVLKEKDFDLILSDYNIDGSKSGKDLINRIREGEIFTEILFYSAKSDFDEVAKGLYQDRVSYLSLVNDDGFRAFKRKVTRLIELTIKKLQELNSIRGLVMAETSSLDSEIVDIISTYLAEENDNSETLRKYIIGKVQRSCDDNVKSAKKLNEKSNNELLKSRIFDSDKKARSLNKLIELQKMQGELLNKFYDNYRNDVLQVRNDLAHAKSARIDGIEYLVLTSKDGDQHIKWNQAKCVDVRKNLLKYSTVLQEIRQNIMKK